MAFETIRLEGLPDLRSAFDRISRVLANDPAAASRVGVAALGVIKTDMVVNRLSGQYLKVRSGKLRSSWLLDGLPDGGAVLGTATEYGPPHEFGSNKTVTCVRRSTGKSFQRRSNLRERRYFRDSIEKTRDSQLETAGRAFQRELRR